MPVMSYLAYPSRDQADTMQEELGGLPEVELIASEGREVFILVTDTADEQAEQQLQERMRALPGLDALVLVSAFADDAAGEP
jgi:nitrate reductase NapAB chaperone NapD